MRFTIQLAEDERKAVLKLANREYRDARQQVAYLVRLQLMQMGLLESADSAESTTPGEPAKEL